MDQIPNCSQGLCFKCGKRQIYLTSFTLITRSTIVPFNIRNIHAYPFIIPERRRRISRSSHFAHRFNRTQSTRFEHPLFTRIQNVQLSIISLLGQSSAMICVKYKTEVYYINPLRSECAARAPRRFAPQVGCRLCGDNRCLC